jgi:hypothetical protein
MRRFKCQVDLDDNVLVFGGKGGVSVPFLSQHEAMAVAQQMIAASNMAPTSAAAAAASAAAVTRRQEQSQYSLEDHIKSFFKL